MTIQEYNDLYKNMLIKKMLITSSGGVTITNTNICTEEMSLEESLCSDDNLTIGACESSCFKIRIADLNHNFVGEWLNVSQELHTDIEGYLLNEDGSYILNEDGFRIQLEYPADGIAKYGRFKVFSDKPTNDRRWRDLVCYDAMYDILNADVIEWYNGLTFPMTVRNFRYSFFTHLGIVQKSQTLVNDTFEIQGGFSNDGVLSGKMIITSICEFNGVFGHITRDGLFEYISLPSTDTLSLDWYMDGTGAYEDYTVDRITGILAKSTPDDVGTTVGTDTNLYTIENNPLIFGSEGSESLTDALTNLLNNVKNITYRPFNVNTYGNPMLPIGTNVIINTRNQTINSFVMSRVLSGIQSLVDSISARGEQTRPTQANSLRSEMKRTKGKIHEIVNTTDELRSTIEDLDENVSSEIQQLSSEIVLKVDASGNIVKVALTADASTGSTFAVNANNITFTAGSVMKFLANNIQIQATNFSLDSAGNVVCNNLKATNADISGKIVSNSGEIGEWKINSLGLFTGDSSVKYSNWSIITPSSIRSSYSWSSSGNRRAMKYELSPTELLFRDVDNDFDCIQIYPLSNYGSIDVHSAYVLDTSVYGQNKGMSVSVLGNRLEAETYTDDEHRIGGVTVFEIDTYGIKHRQLIGSGDQVAYINSLGSIKRSSITLSELNCLSGITRGIQGWLNSLDNRVTALENA